MNKNIKAGIAGSLLATSMLAPNTANAEGEVIDAWINTEDSTCAVGSFAMNFSIDGLSSNSSDQSQAPSIDQTNEANVAVIETPVELINYTDGPAKFILKSITKSKDNGRYVTRDVVKVKDGKLKETNIYTATPLASDASYRIKVSAKGLGPISSTEKISIAENCE